MRLFYRNQLRIGISFGIGIELGIGIVAQPSINNDRRNSMIIIRAILGLFLNFKVSPIDLYNFAHYKGFSQAFARIL